MKQLFVKLSVLMLVVVMGIQTAEAQQKKPVRPKAKRSTTAPRTSSKNAAENSAAALAAPVVPKDTVKPKAPDADIKMDPAMPSLRNDYAFDEIL